MLTPDSQPFRPGDVIVHRRPHSPANGGVLFGEKPHAVSSVAGDRVRLTIGGENVMITAAHVNFAPRSRVCDPLGRALTVVHEVEPAPDGTPMTRVVDGNVREWIPTDMLRSANTEPELTIWGTRQSGRSITWWHDEYSARHASSKGPSVEVVTITGRPTVVDRSPAVGHLALVDTDELRRALEAGPSAIATLIGQLSDKSDFLTDVEEALGTPGGISRLIADHRGTSI
jgi:hypothetical protein